MVQLPPQKKVDEEGEGWMVAGAPQGAIQDNLGRQAKKVSKMDTDSSKDQAETGNKHKGNCVLRHSLFFQLWESLRLSWRWKTGAGIPKALFQGRCFRQLLGLSSYGTSVLDNSIISRRLR